MVLSVAKLKLTDLEKGERVKLENHQQFAGGKVTFSDLKGRFVSLDALHTQTDTARELVLEAGADYLLTAKDNQPTVHQNIQKLLPAPEADFPPSQADAHGIPHSGL